MGRFRGKVGISCAIKIGVSRRVEKLIDTQHAENSGGRMRRLHELAERLEFVMKRATALRQQAEEMLAECRQSRQPRLLTDQTK
jgi:hypothetical protein